MRETRARFHQELADVSDKLVSEGRMAEDAVGRAVESIARQDAETAAAVIEGDLELDTAYLDVEHRVFTLLATQTPVASDLRLVSAVMHMNRHVERIGDQAVNIAKTALQVRQLATDPVILSHLVEMSDRVRAMVLVSIDAFSNRDLELARQLSAMDEPVDVLNRAMYADVVRLAPDAARLEWGILMNVVARHLERVGDNAVDIAAQVSFLLTGEFPHQRRSDGGAT